MGDTSIEWTRNEDGSGGKTWNPTDGCDVVSPGCTNCYAMRFAGRFSKPGQRYHGLVTIAKNKRAVWSGECHLDAKKLGAPLTWRKPTRVFVNSMSDLFYERFTNEEIAAVFGVMAACPQHTFMILTKRATRMREWFEWLDEKTEPQAAAWSDADCSVSIHDARDVCRVLRLLEFARDALPPHQKGHVVRTHEAIEDDAAWPLPNVWPGVSVEDRKHGVPRIHELRGVPATVRMLSCEPLLEDLGAIDLTDIGWVVAGGESGPGARYVDPSAYRSLRDQCAAAGTPFFFKQGMPWDEGRERVVAMGVGFGEGSKRKAGGIIGAPYFDGVQHLAFPVSRG